MYVHFLILRRWKLPACSLTSPSTEFSTTGEVFLWYLVRCHVGVGEGQLSLVQKLCQEQQKRLWLLGGGEEGEGRRRNRNANFSLAFLPLDLLQGHILFSSFLSSTCPKQKEAGRQ